MSNISDIHDLIQAMSVSYTDVYSNTVTPTAYKPSQLKNSVQASALPLRILVPFADGEQATVEFTEIFIGNEAPITWVFVEQFLMRPAAQGVMEDVAKDVFEFCSAYNTAALALSFGSISDRVTLDGLRIVLRPDIEFPQYSGNFYVGCDCVWTVTEDDPV